MRRTRRTRGPDERLAARFWHEQVVRGRCVMCRAFPLGAQEHAGRKVDLKFKEGHHVLPKRHLKTNGFAAQLWDVRNGICVCRYHHARHENFTQRIPRALLPPAAFEFAAELALAWLLDREYPEPGLQPAARTAL